LKEERGEKVSFTVPFLFTFLDWKSNKRQPIIHQNGMQRVFLKWNSSSIHPFSLEEEPGEEEVSFVFECVCVLIVPPLLCLTFGVDDRMISRDGCIRRAQREGTGRDGISIRLLNSFSIHLTMQRDHSRVPSKWGKYAK
jgi:hypothetical protein